MKKLLLSICSVLAMAIPSNGQILNTTVAQGEIEGVLENGFALYKNIPYAEAPVGNLRWKAPVPKAPWKGVYKADKWGLRPFQTTDPNQGGANLPMSEDCLYLSVQTPAMSKDDKLPVFVMIHGGGFTTGSYAGTQDSFVKEGIIYCSIEYRLGVLGFLTHPELSKESPMGISGNYGLMDQLLALQWIHDNIAAFGGDPEKITIAGESAGGISVSMHCASPLAKGLFRGAICESGSSFWPVGADRSKNTAIADYKSAEQIGLDLQKRLGKKNIKQLRQVPAEELVKDVPMGAIWPVVDGYIITDDQYKLYEKGEYNDVPVLLGTNSDEGMLFTRPMSLDAYKAMANAVYGDMADKFLEAYPANNDMEACFALADMNRDCMFAWGTYAWANLQRQTGKSNVYMYYFDQDSEQTIFRSPRGGAIHVAEMPFIYGYQFKPQPFTELEKHMCDIISKYWINFTKTGNPNSDGLPYWANYEKDKPSVMIMKNGLHLDVVPNQKQLDFFEEYFKAQRNK
ncbi:MAG: carboxylesterase family protein [Bacteroidia bacterium]|nr:carboxylesterase family protein [Bacteroidia bacterium]